MREVAARALEARDPACGVAGVLAGEAVEADFTENVAVVVEGEVVGQALFIHDSAQLLLGVVNEIDRMTRLGAACHLPEALVGVFYILLRITVVEDVVDAVVVEVDAVAVIVQDLGDAPDEVEGQFPLKTIGIGFEGAASECVVAVFPSRAKGLDHLREVVILIECDQGRAPCLLMDFGGQTILVVDFEHCALCIDALDEVALVVVAEFPLAAVGVHGLGERVRKLWIPVFTRLKTAGRVGDGGDIAERIMRIDRLVTERVAVDFELIEAVVLFGPGLAIAINLVVHEAVAVIIGGLDAEAVHGVGDAFLVSDVVVMEVAVAPGLDAMRTRFDAIPAEKRFASVAPGLLDEEVAGAQRAASRCTSWALFEMYGSRTQLWNSWSMF